MYQDERREPVRRSPCGCARSLQGDMCGIRAGSEGCCGGCNGAERSDTSQKRERMRREGGCGCDGDRSSRRDMDGGREGGCGCGGAQNARRETDGRMEDGCGCEGAPVPCRDAEGRRRWGLEEHPLAMVYAPVQNFCGLYDEVTALSRGTVFGELDLPFLVGDCKKGGGCRG